MKIRINYNFPVENGQYNDALVTAVTQITIIYAIT